MSAFVAMVKLSFIVGGAFDDTGAGGLNGLALCAGFGGLEGGLERSLPEYRTVCYVEGEAYPAAVLVQKMEKGTVRKAPIWSNVVTFDGKPWRGKVDIISGGFPCQPHSQAGKLLGKDDPRNLWPSIVRIIGEVRPRFLFLENVANINNTYGKEIVGNLAQMGFDAAWCVVRASDVGAPHRRARWFLLASHTDNSPELIKSIHESLKGSSELEEDVFDYNDSHAERGGFNENKFDSSKGKPNLKGLCDVADSSSIRRGQNNGFRKSKFINKDDTVFNPNNGHHHKEKEISTGRDSFVVSSWWEVEPGVGRMVDGLANWSHRIRGCGNGVVPQQAAYAFQILAGRLACGIDANREPSG